MCGFWHLTPGPQNFTVRIRKLETNPHMMFGPGAEIAERKTGLKGEAAGGLTRMFVKFPGLKQRAELTPEPEGVDQCG